LGIQPNSAALFYRKIRQVIAFHFAQEASEVFNGEVEINESYFS
jgi:transposase